MKKYLLFISLITLPFVGFSQTEVLQLDSMHYNHTGSSYLIKGVRYYQHDDNNRITEILTRSRLSSSPFGKKVVYDYFDNENKEIKTCWSWENAIQTWHLDSQIVRYFDDLDRIVIKEVFHWNDNSNSFTLSKTNRYEYNERGNLTLRVLDKHQKTEWTYNDRNLLESIRYTYWDWSLNTWKNSFSLENYTYNNDRLLTSKIVSNWGGNWIQNELYDYDNKNRLNTKRFYHIDLQAIDTLYQYIKTYSYQGNSNQYQKSIFQSKSKSLQSLYNYDNFGNIETVTTQVKDDHGTWQNYDRNSSWYNEKNLIAKKMESEYWDSYREEWSNSAWITEEFTYYDNKELKEYSYDFNDRICGNGSFASNYTYFRSKKSIETESTPTNINCLFPNPYTNFQQVHCDEFVAETIYDLKVFNIIGQSVYETKFSGRNGFFIEKQLHEGWYVFVILENGKIIGKQKILVF